MRYRFGEFELCTDRFELTRDGEPVRLQPRTLRLLALLIASDGRLVSKDEILDKIWDGRAVSESALSTQVKLLRKALQEAKRPYRLIGTVHGEGYRFLAESSACAARKSRPSEVAAPASAHERVGSRPSIAVLPFKALGTNIRGAALTEALPDEIITALSQLHLLHVIARGSSFQFPSVTFTPGTVREKLGVDYCLSGTVELNGKSLSVSAELADARRNGIVWCERFTTDIRGIHEVRMDIVDSIVSATELRITFNEAERTKLTVPDELTAWEAYHLGMSHVFMRGEANNQRAKSYFEKALAIEPHFSRAHAGLSHTNWWLIIQRTLTDVDDGAAMMLEAANQAVDTDPFDPAANLAMGRALAILENTEEGIMWSDRSVQFCPNYAWGHNHLASLRAFTDEPQKAIDHAHRAIALSPHDPLRHSMYAALAVAHFNNGEIEEAAEWGRKAVQLPHSDLMVMVAALCTNFAAGYRDEAARVARKIRSTHPNATCESIARTNPMMSPETRAVMTHILVANGIE